MPFQPPTQCRHRSCSKLVPYGQPYCDEHKHLYVSERASAGKRGYNSRWQKARAAYLKAHPLCVHCMQQLPPRYTKATVVDHIKPHRGDKELFWDRLNWQALCKQCHDKKTWREDSHPTYDYKF